MSADVVLRRELPHWMRPPHPSEQGAASPRAVIDRCAGLVCLLGGLGSACTAHTQHTAEEVVCGCVTATMHRNALVYNVLLPQD